MKAFKVIINITEKRGFARDGLKRAITDDLAEIRLSLIDFAYNNGTCECIIEYNDFGSTLPYYQIVLGSIQGLSMKYPHISIEGVNPEFVEI